MSYQQYPIYDLKSGLRLERKPWLTPADGFRTMENAFVRRGVIEKRRGIGNFGRMIHTIEVQISGASGTFANTPLVPGSVTITDGIETVTDVLKYQVAFTNGGTDEPHVGDQITGVTSAKTAFIYSITVSAGTWAGGDAVGIIYLVLPSGSFTAAGEAVAVGAETPFTIAAGGLVSTGLYVLAGDDGGRGTINHTSGAWTLTWAVGEPMYHIGFTAGGITAISVGATIRGATSTRTATVHAIHLISGSWAGGDAKGYLDLHQPSGAFTPAGEVATVTVGTGDPFALIAGGAVEAIATYSWYPGHEVMGIYQHRSDSERTLLAVNVNRMNKYNTTTSLFEDISTKKMHFTLGKTGLAATAIIYGETSGSWATVDYVEVTSGTLGAGTAAGIIHISDQYGTFTAAELVSTDTVPSVAKVTANASYFELTSADTNFVWFDTWNGITYLTNNKDPLQRFDGTRIRQLNIDLVTSPVGGPLNHVNSALMVIIFKSRVLLFSTTESSVAYRQRVRYSNVNSDQLWDPDDYLDCPTSDWITGARFIGDQLVVTFSKSVWRLVYTGDSDLPYRWERISGEFGGVSPFSMVAFDRRIEILGETELSACMDAIEVKKMDQQIPDFVLETTVNVIGYSYSIKVDELQQVWMTYTSRDSSDTKPDRMLIRNYDENTWATLDLTGLGIHCMGFFRWEASPTWDDFPAAVGLPATATVDDLNVPLDFIQGQAGFPILLLGNRTGYVYQYSVVYSDLTVDMPVEIQGGKWNPFVQQGKKARLGWIDFMVDNVPDGGFTVSVYLDDESTPSYILTVDCESSRPGDTMKIVKVYVGAVANFFTLKITSEDANPMKIHAVIPAFQPAGRIEYDG